VKTGGADASEQQLPVDQVVVLAGGLGTRMLPRTESIPKFLLPVSGRPFGARLLERLAACGFARALLCIGHLGSAIRHEIGDGRAFGLDVEYADEGSTPLGTAGALRAASARLEPTFLVTYGDSYLPFDYKAPLRDLRAHPEALATMAVYPNHDRWDTSNTSLRGELVVRYAKREAGARRDPELDHIDYGATALRRSVLERIPANAPFGLERLHGELASEGALRGLVASDRFFEIGSDAGLRDLEQALAQMQRGPAASGGGAS
jgi:NDP-sugar pyrophosphorylase family protein